MTIFEYTIESLKIVVAAMIVIISPLIPMYIVAGIGRLIEWLIELWREHESK